MMRFQLITGIFLLFGITHHVNCARLEPPKFTKPDGTSWGYKQGNLLIVRPDTETKILCDAKGSPTYQWYKNGDLLRMTQNVFKYNMQTGTLTLGEGFLQQHEGLFHCVARNSQGTSMTPDLQVKIARFDIYPDIAGQDAVISVNVAATKYFKMPCSKMPTSIPDAKALWKSGRTATQEVVISEGDRIIYDPYGNLHFLWVENSDAKLYTCGYANSFIGIDIWNIQKQDVRVNDGSVNSDIAPDLRFNENVVVMAGKDAVLICIFSYYSTTQEILKVKWYLKGNWLNKNDSTSVTKYMISKANVTHEGAYKCIGSVGKSSDQGIVKLSITSPPQFINSKSPMETYAPVESDAVFYCEASSYKAHKKAPVWMVNAIPVVGCHPTKFECDNKNSSNGYPVCISISNRCDAVPDCPDGSDELNCLESCPEGQVNCDHKCIPKANTCIKFPCDWPDYMCIKDYSCIQSKKLCNNIADCSDGTDEVDCVGGSDFNVSRYKFNSQKTTLTIPDVKLLENLCVQCAISNDYGTAFGGGCLTVIDKIHIHSQPNKTYNVSPGMNFALVSNATTDPLFAEEMKYTWYLYIEVKNEMTGLTAIKQIELPSNILETYFTPHDNNKLINVRVPSDPHNNEDQFEVYKMLAGEPGEGREYSLIISHPHDRYEFNFSMYDEEVLPPVIFQVIPHDINSSFILWLIAVILGIIVLIALVIFIVYMVCKRNPRGAGYGIEMERRQGDSNNVDPHIHGDVTERIEEYESLSTVDQVQSDQNNFFNQDRNTYEDLQREREDTHAYGTLNSEDDTVDQVQSDQNTFFNQDRNTYEDLQREREDTHAYGTLNSQDDTVDQVQSDQNTFFNQDRNTYDDLQREREDTHAYGSLNSQDDTVDQVQRDQNTYFNQDRNTYEDLQRERVDTHPYGTLNSSDDTEKSSKTYTEKTEENLRLAPIDREK